MTDAVLIQQVYPGHGMECLLDLTQEKHKAYCMAHSFDYWQERSFVMDWPIEHGCWGKVELIRRALEKYQYVVWLDADTFIEDMDTDLRDACKGIGAVKFRLRPTKKVAFNTGALYIRNTEKSNHFIGQWLAGYPGPNKDHEQGVFNTMEEIRALPPCWNYTIDRHFDPQDIIVRGYHSIREIGRKLDAMRRDFLK